MKYNFCSYFKSLYEKFVWMAVKAVYNGFDEGILDLIDIFNQVWGWICIIFVEFIDANCKVPINANKLLLDTQFWV